MNDNSMWSVLWGCVALVLIAGFCTAKGCNDSDDVVLKAAAEKGCDLRVYPGGSTHQILCGTNRILLP